ncbi:MAG: hypothetical protein N2234_07185 [Planctomycetota bacterium]|nr:hypothetical protein [Planctomycetota bacterium]
MAKIFLTLIMVLVGVSVFGQELQPVGRIEDGWEYAEIKNPRPTDEFMKFHRDWQRREIFVGSELRTTRGEKSQFELAFLDDSFVEMHPGSRIVVKKDKDVVVLEMAQGGVTVFSGGRLIVKTPEGTLKAERGFQYSVQIGKEGREAEYVSTKGELLVENRLGVVFAVKEGAKALLKYDEKSDTYSLLVAPESKGEVFLRGKEEQKLGVDGVALLSGEGKFVVKEKGAPPEAEKKIIIGEGLKAKFEFVFVFSGYDYEQSAEYNYYRGQTDRFGLEKAELIVKGEFKDFLSACISADGSKDEMLNNAYVELFHPEYKEKFALRFGQFRVPFGKEVQEGVEKLLFGDRSLGVQYGFCGLQGAPNSSDSGLMYDIGFAISGYLIGKKEEDGFAIDYNTGFFNGAGRNSTENDSRKTFCGRLGIRLAKWLIIGGSYYDGRTTTAKEEYHRRRRGADISLHLGFMKLSGEYIYAVDDPRVGKHGNDTESFYLQGQMPLGFFGSFFETLSLIFRYEVMDPALNSIPGISKDDWEKVTRWDIGFRVDMSKNVAMILFFQHLDQGDIRYPLGVEVEESDDLLKFVVVVKCF